MINFRDVFHQSELRATANTLRVLPTELPLQNAIASLGAPQNPTAPNTNPNEINMGRLRADSIAIKDGLLAP